MRRPLVSLVAATALLLAAAVPVLSIDTGFSGLSTLPDRFPSKQGFDALNRDFPGTGVDPAQIVIEGDVSSAPVQSAIEQLKASLAEQDAFGPSTQTKSEAQTSSCSRFRSRATPMGLRRRARSATFAPT